MKLNNSSPNFTDRFLGRIEINPASDRFLLRLFFFIVLATGIFLLLSFNFDNTGVTATRGGTIHEGILGTPRFVNPALAITRADQDVTSLVYSGLLKTDGEGNLIPDVAESVTVSDDGLTYNIVLRQDVIFHDGEPLTARDVIYTIQLIQDPDLKSPLRGNWSDVVVEEINRYELNVVLEEPYAPFIENFTVGIMPAHLWSSLPVEQLPFSQLNTEPIGTGPFMLERAVRDASGLIDTYTLSAFRERNEQPKINTIVLHFYSNELEILVDLEDGEIQSSAYISNEQVATLEDERLQVIEEPLPRVFGIFFNQNRSSALRDQAVREALSTAIDRSLLIETALFGYGVPIDSPIALPQSELESGDGTEAATSSPLQQAEQILIDADWERTEFGFWEKEIDDSTVPLQITLRTSNAPLFAALVDEIARQWKELGVDVVTEQFEQTGLTQSVIRPRDFQALLFGIDTSRSYDLYPFWHSSQKDDPGLNIAQYTNLTVDELLESARIEQDQTARIEATSEAVAIIKDESPAIFLFQPSLVYVVSTDIKTTPILRPSRPSDRFNTVTDWHTENESLWPLFREEI